APGDGPDFAAGRGKDRLEILEVTEGRSRRRVAAVRESVDDDARDGAPARHLEEAEEVPLVRVDPAVGKQSHQVERRARPLRGLARSRQGRVLEEGSVAQREVDPEEILRHHPTGAEV